MSLLVSIHDVAPPHLAAVRRLRAALARWGVPHVTLLAVPRYHDRLALGACRDTTRFLRSQLAHGDEICLHGDRHLQSNLIPRWQDRLRARLWTAGEGECLSLDEAARTSMLTAGRDLLQDLLGQPVHGFVAPAWLEPRGFHRALVRAGFLWHEGGPWVARLDPAGVRTVVSRWPVVGFATRTLLREAVSVSWAGLLGRLLARRARRAVRRAPTSTSTSTSTSALASTSASASASAPDVLVRVALHPGDLASSHVMNRAETIIRAVLAHTPARTYSAALGGATREGRSPLAAASHGALLPSSLAPASVRHPVSP